MKSSSPSLVRTIFLFAAGALWLAGCTRKPEAAPPAVLKVGYLPLSATIPLFVATEKNYFAQGGVRIDLVKYQNGALLAQDVISGRIDAASPGPADVYLKAETETPGRFQIYLQTAYTPDNFIYSLLTRKQGGIANAA